MGYWVEKSATRIEGARRCPFCGGDEIVVSSREFYEGIVAEHGHACVTAECTDCYAKTYYFGLEDKDQSYEHMIEMVMDKWNARHNKQTELPA